MCCVLTVSLKPLPNPSLVQQFGLISFLYISYPLLYLSFTNWIRPVNHSCMLYCPPPPRPSWRPAPAPAPAPAPGRSSGRALARGTAPPLTLRIRSRRCLLRSTSGSSWSGREPPSSAIRPSLLRWVSGDKGFLGRRVSGGGGCAICRAEEIR